MNENLIEDDEWICPCTEVGKCLENEALKEHFDDPDFDSDICKDGCVWAYKKPKDVNNKNS